MSPTWLHLLATASLALGFVCAAIILADIVGDPQHMWIMNVVWPITALFAGLFALAGYRTYGKLATERRVTQAKRQGEEMPSKRWQRLHARRHSRRMAGCFRGVAALIRSRRDNRIARLRKLPMLPASTSASAPTS